MPAAPPRPPALTLTCAFVGAGSLLALFQLMGFLSDGGSVEVQDAVREGLAAEPLAGAGIGVDQALEWLRILAYVGLVLATSGAVFAFYTARGHRPSRIALTVLCVLTAVAFAAAGLAGILFALFAGMCAASLWTADSRRWFAAVQDGAVQDGRGQDGRGQDGKKSTREHATTVSRPRTGKSGESASRPDPFGGPSPVPAATASPDESGTSGEAEAGAVPRPDASVPARRPAPLTSAAVITLVSSALVGLFSLLTLLTSTLGADLYRDALSQPGMAQDILRSSDVTADDLITATRWFSAAWVALCAAAIPSAVAALRGSPGGVVGVRVCAILTLPLSVLGTFAGVLTGGAAIVVLVLLARPEVKRWTQRR